MMMSKPAPSSSKEEKPKKKTAEDAVKDLERRLQMLGDAAPGSVSTDDEEEKPAAAPTPAAAAQPATSSVKGGKNALLARIMAAQEKTKQSQPKPPPPQEDLLLSENPAPPPAFDEAQLPPPAEQPPPPSFEAVEDTLPTTSMNQWDPHAPAVAVPPTPSAPSFEDLLSMEDHQHHAPVAPPPPPAEPSVEEVFGLEGLSDEDRQALLEEQAKILAAIESEKSANEQAIAAARADAFEQRSFSAAVQSVGNTTNVSKVHLGSGQEVALHGQEKTKEAIQKGTALKVQCLSCQRWMQVTQSATLMFCPVCQTVSPVLQQEMTDAEAAQLVADAELAEQLQKEEYKNAERQERQQRERQKQQDEHSSGWMEWLGLSSGEAATSTSPERPPQFAQQPSRPLQRGEIGTTRPPGALAPARTGEEETVSFSRSYDEDEALLDRDRARVAEQKSLFNCVADSVSYAATALNTQTLASDEEGNVHGVDSSSLLAMPNVGREQHSYDRMEDKD